MRVRSGFCQCLFVNSKGHDTVFQNIVQERRIWEVVKHSTTDFCITVPMEVILPSEFTCLSTEQSTGATASSHWHEELKSSSLENSEQWVKLNAVKGTYRNLYRSNKKRETTEIPTLPTQQGSDVSLLGWAVNQESVISLQITAMIAGHTHTLNRVPEFQSLPLSLQRS